MKCKVLDTCLDDLTMQQTVEKVEGFVVEKNPRRIVTANPELIYSAAADSSLCNLINTADLVTADGEGVLWAARILGMPLTERVTGIDLVQSLFATASAKKWKIFLLGAAPGVAAEAARRIGLDFPGILFETFHGYFEPGMEERLILDKIKSFTPHLLLVGLGAPRQEEWIAVNYRDLLVPVSLGVGGSFDVLSGNLRRAPDWVRKAKLEWLYRLLSEPSRLKRQLVLPKFVVAVLRAKITKKPQK